MANSVQSSFLNTRWGAVAAGAAVTVLAACSPGGGESAKKATTTTDVGDELPTATTQSATSTVENDSPVERVHLDFSDVTEVSGVDNGFLIPAEIEREDETETDDIVLVNGECFGQLDSFRMQVSASQDKVAIESAPLEAARGRAVADAEHATAQQVIPLEERKTIAQARKQDTSVIQQEINDLENALADTKSGLQDTYDDGVRPIRRTHDEKAAGAALNVEPDCLERVTTDLGVNAVFCGPNPGASFHYGSYVNASDSDGYKPLNIYNSDLGCGTNSSAGTSTTLGG